MLQFIINFYILFINFLFTQLKHPLSIGFILLIQTFLISLTIGIMSKTFWFSYILFLVFLGGMLVIFIYVTSLSSNEMFTFSMNFFLLFLIMTLIMISMIYMIDFYYMNFSKNLEMNMILNKDYLFKENSSELMKIYNFPINLITILLIYYLFFTLIISVKITNFFYGPLRNMN